MRPGGLHEGAGGLVVGDPYALHLVGDGEGGQQPTGQFPDGDVLPDPRPGGGGGAGVGGVEWREQPAGFPVLAADGPVDPVVVGQHGQPQPQRRVGGRARGVDAHVEQRLVGVECPAGEADQRVLVVGVQGGRGDVPAWVAGAGADLSGQRRAERDGQAEDDDEGGGRPGGEPGTQPQPGGVRQVGQGRGAGAAGGGQAERGDGGVAEAGPQPGVRVRSDEGQGGQVQRGGAEVAQQHPPAADGQFGAEQSGHPGGHHRDQHGVRLRVPPG